MTLQPNPNFDPALHKMPQAEAPHVSREWLLRHNAGQLGQGLHTPENINLEPSRPSQDVEFSAGNWILVLNSGRRRNEPAPG